MFTVLGSNGFIGSHLKKYLETIGEEGFYPPRDYVPDKNKNLGNVFYCIGLTADFRTRLFDTVNAHVIRLSEFLERATFDSFLYMSTTRVYAYSDSTGEEEPVKVNSSNSDDLYAISKLLGEAVCLSIAGKNVKVVRLSNVIGNDFRSENFLMQLITGAIEKKNIELRAHPMSEKDYVDIKTVVPLLLKILSKGKHRLYNIANGKNMNHLQIVEKIQEQTGCTVKMDFSAPLQSFPVISIQRLKEEFEIQPTDLMGAIPQLIQSYKKVKGE